MADDDERASVAEPTGAGERTSPAALAGVASIAAGGTAAYAAGTLDHRQGVVLLVLLAAGQFSWGIWAVLRTNRPGVLLGAILHFTALALWLGAATSGLSFIQGLEARWSLDAVVVAAIVASAGAGFGALARLIDGRPEAEQPAPQLGLVWAATAAATIAVALAAVVSVEPPSSRAPDEAPIPVAVATTVGGPIGLPTGGGDIDDELGALIEASNSTTTSAAPPTTPG